MKDFSKVSINCVKNFWNNRPCNIKHSNKPFCSKEYFEEIEKKKYFVEPHIPKFAEFEKYNGKKVLEIGCGIGTDSINFVRNGAILTIVELSEKSLEICKKRFQIFGLKANFYLGNCENLSDILPQNEKYDLIYSFGVLHHTPQPTKVIKEIEKFLNSNAELKLMLYSKFSYKLFWIMKEQNIWDFSKLDEIISFNSEAQSDCPVTYTYTFDDVKNLLINFDIVDIHKDHIFPYKIYEYKQNIYVFEDCFINMDYDEFKKMENELGWHTLIYAKKK